MTLERKIPAFEEAYRGGCLKETEPVYLGMIADHGYAAADEMVRLIKTPHPDFPLRDAVLVLSFVNAQGTNLKLHPAHEVLRELSNESRDPAVREEARRTLLEIDARTKGP